MTQFKIPPSLARGKLVVGSDELVASDFTWRAIDLADPYAVNEERLRTTSIGTAKVQGRTVRVVLGFNEEDDTPFFSITYFGDADRHLERCTFDFEEVQA
ncbi:hypothetical protein HGG73_14435 [Rhodobacteraceae bacterium R_SAG3]|nr:hypothetical protein [Rhodobacteraceae bacterium R_SAG3]